MGLDHLDLVRLDLDLDRLDLDQDQLDLDLGLIQYKDPTSKKYPPL